MISESGKPEACGPCIPHPLGWGGRTQFDFIVIPHSSAVGIKGMRIQFRDGSGQHVPSLCGGALHAPPALLRGAPPPFDFS